MALAPPATPRGLEFSPAQMRRLLAQITERLIRHEEQLPDRPAEDLEGAADLARSLREGLPETGTTASELLGLLFDRAIPKSITTGGPQQLSYIPGSGLFAAAAADLVATATNRFVGIWFAAPALSQLEKNVVDWCAKIVGLGARSGGFLTPGGSTANLYAAITARRVRFGDDFRDAVVYASDQSHASVQRSAMLAGFASDRFRVVPSGDDFRMDVAALEAALEKDARAGLRPGFVVANAGSTNTGAVDDLPRIAKAARKHGAWFHADAAYGGFFALTTRGKTALKGLGLADSVTLDPHKGLFLPYGTGAVVVRNVDDLHRAHSVHAEYMPPREEPDLVDFHDISPELSRDFRGLRAWFPLKLHGAKVFRAYLDEKWDLARFAAGRLARVPHVRIVASPQLSTFAFRVEPPGVTAEAADILTQQVLAQVVRRGRVHLSGTTTKGRYLARVSVLSFRTHADRLRMAVEDIAAAVKAKVPQPGKASPGSGRGADRRRL